MPDFSRRATGPEMMDDFELAGPDLSQALRELDGINRLLGGNYVTINGLSLLMGNRMYGGDVHIADLGCGSGDILRRIRRLLEKKNCKGRLTGIDANPHVITFAKTHTPASSRIQYEVLNIFSAEFQAQKIDIITGTLFFHHFTDEELVSFFRGLKKFAKVGIVINDIHRHWFAYYSIKWLTLIFSRSPMVKNDAPISVLRAFKRKDLINILDLAGLPNFRIRWCWAFRWQVVIWL